MTTHKKSPQTPDKSQRGSVPTSWDALAYWYDGWVGAEGSEHHKQVAIPAMMDLLAPQPGERILDLGAGQGVLAPYIARSGAAYTGVDAGARLIKLARQRHGKEGRFLVGDARDLSSLHDLHEGEFDAVTFLLSIQDMDPLDAVLRSAAWALKPGGRVVHVADPPRLPSTSPERLGLGRRPKAPLPAGRQLPDPSSRADENAAGRAQSCHAQLPPSFRRLHQQPGIGRPSCRADVRSPGPQS